MNLFFLRFDKNNENYNISQKNKSTIKCNFSEDFN